MLIVKGDLFQNIDPNYETIIPHVCNDIGAWGAGFVVPLGKNYPQAKEDYKKAIARHELNGGETQFVEINDKLIIANMVAQKGIYSEKNLIPIQYLWLKTCMVQVGLKAIETGSRIIAPKFGSGLAGGDWEVIERMIEDCWVNSGIDVTIFTLE